MAEILNIQRPVIFDESVSHYEVHAHQPYASSTLNNSDEIRIAVQHQDLCILPSKSSLHVCGKISKADDTPITNTTKIVNMAVCHMFAEIRYELNAVEIDRNKNVGITSLMKGYASATPGQRNLMENAGWLFDESSTLINAAGYFDVSIPLSCLLGFAEDYHKVIINAKHELILIRSNTDINAYTKNNDDAVKIDLQKLEWIVPYITMSDKQRIEALTYIRKDPVISMSFRNWELYEYPLLPATSKHVWSVKTSTQLEKPRYIIIGFQTGRKNNTTRSSSQFDHCNLRDVKLFLNSQSYPYGNLNLNIDHHQYALLYDMYADFQSSYYGKNPEPLLTRNQFLEQAPLYVIDCSKQNESIKTGPVDIRVEFESYDQFPANTAAYCLILHDRIIEYNPISNNVRKLS